MGLVQRFSISLGQTRQDITHIHHHSSFFVHLEDERRRLMKSSGVFFSHGGQGSAINFNLLSVGGQILKIEGAHLLSKIWSGK